MPGERSFRQLEAMHATGASEGSMAYVTSVHLVRLDDGVVSAVKALGRGSAGAHLRSAVAATRSISETRDVASRSKLDRNIGQMRTARRAQAADEEGPS